MDDQSLNQLRDELNAAKEQVRALTLRNEELERELAAAYRALTKSHVCPSPRPVRWK
jgi:hypothetical protein